MEDRTNTKKNDGREKGEMPVAGGAPSGARERIRGEYRPLGRKMDPVSAAEALLKVPGRILFELRNGNSLAVASSLGTVALICFLAYGLTVGTFSWGKQFWAAPLKVTFGAFLSALICFPSLVVFSFLSGSDTTVREIFALLAAALALASLLLLGFGPVSWIFTQSTESAAFMGALHVLFWMIGLSYGIRFLGAATGFLHGDGGRHIAVWCAVFLIVSLQMMTTLRPIVGTGDTFFQREKKFFLTHWMETIDSASRRNR